MASNSANGAPATGKFYLNIPNPASNPNDGVVLQIDPLAEKIEKTFSLTGSGCDGNTGMALGPSNQALLGCSNAGPNSVIININTGGRSSLSLPVTPAPTKSGTIPAITSISWQTAIGLRPAPPRPVPSSE